MNAPEKLAVQPIIDLDQHDLQLLAQIAATRYGADVERTLVMNLSDPRALYAAEAINGLDSDDPYYATVILARDAASANVDVIATLAAFGESGALRVVVVEPTSASFMALNDALVAAEESNGFGMFKQNTAFRRPGKN